MRDEEDGHAELILQVAHDVEDLRLGGDVEGGGGLVSDEQARAAGEGHGDHDALAHAAAELVAIGIQQARRLREAHAVQQLDGIFGGLRLAGIAMQADGLDHLVADSVHRAERGHRFLEDDGDLAPAQIAGFLAFGVKTGDIERSVGVAIPEDLALVDAPWPLHHVEDGAGGDALATARFTDDAERLAVLQAEVDAGDSVHGPLGQVEVDVEITYLEQRVGHGQLPWRLID